MKNKNAIPDLIAFPDPEVLYDEVMVRERKNGHIDWMEKNQEKLTESSTFTPPMYIVKEIKPFSKVKEDPKKMLKKPKKDADNNKEKR